MSRESVPLLSVGASLMVLLPAAHVALPSAAVERLSPRSRLRVIAAGALHNLVTWIILWLLATLGLGGFLWSCLGYRDIGTYGRVVVALDEVLTFLYPIYVGIERLLSAFCPAGLPSHRICHYLRR